PSAYGNIDGAIAWHENVSLKGIVAKMFGYLEIPGHQGTDFGPYEQVGYVVVALPRMHRLGNVVSLLAQAAAVAWMTWMLLAEKAATSWSRESRLLWEWSFVTVMMLIVAPQTAIDYEMLALVAFSFV